MAGNRNSKIVIISGFSLVMLLLSVVSFLAIFSVNENNRRLLDVVSEQSKVVDIFSMRDFSQKRALLLYRMAALDDPFDREEVYLQFKMQAGYFLLAREQLLSKQRHVDEINRWKEVEPIVTKGSSVQNKVADLIQDNQFKQAYEMLGKEVAPIQDEVSLRMTRLLDVQNNVISTQLQTAQSNNRRYLIIIIILGLFALAVSIAVAVYVTNYTSQTENKLIEQQRLADTANQAKSNFLANMSHEIRTPLTAIIGFSQSLLDENFEQQERNKVTQTIIRNGQHLQRLINDILDLSKIEAEQLQIESIITSPLTIMEETDSLLGKKARDRGLYFKLNYRFPLPNKIISDPTRLKQILFNLCGNAIKFTHEGRVEVDMSFDEMNEKMLFKVRDTGIGMTAEELSRLFQPFSQADASITRKYGGTGLGLSISLKLAHVMGGTITCESEKGKGSVFTLSVAAKIPKEAVFITTLERVGEHRDEQTHEVLIKPLRGNILLAEDSPDNQQLIAMYIRRTGATLTIVENGQQAVEEGLAGNYDLIFMDMQMPVMGGVEAITLLRAAGYAGPVVSLTANATVADRDSCLAAGVDDYLVKPINLQRFYEVLNTHLAAAGSDGAGLVSQFGFDNDPEYQAMLDQFHKNLPGMVAELVEAVQQQKWGVIQSISHKIKGIAGSFAYPQITELALQINALTKTAELEKVIVLSGKLATLQQQILQQLKKV